MSSSSISDQSTKRKKKRIPVDSSRDAVTAIRTNSASYPIYYEDKENLISKQVPQNRRQEIYEYLKLFGYKPDNTILQVHIIGFFKKKKYSQRELEKYKSAVKRYGGTTFVVVGRTHDPSIMDKIVTPKKKDPYDRSPGYVGYLWKNKDPEKRPPHETIPLDFTPIHLSYPTEWKNMFATKGFMIALHVPSSFAKYKNKLTRALYRVGRKSSNIDVRKEWSFLDDLKSISAEAISQSSLDSGYQQDEVSRERKQKHGEEEPIDILKTRLAKGQITKEEYQELRKAIEQ
jgi:hypothetical protein